MAPAFFLEEVEARVVVLETPEAGSRVESVGVMGSMDSEISPAYSSIESFNVLAASSSISFSCSRACVSFTGASTSAAPSAGACASASASACASASNLINVDFDAEVRMK